MLQQQTDAAAKSTELAEMATIRALLNSYLRETGERDPRAAIPGLRYFIDSFPKQGDPFMLHLPMIGKTITGAITYYSAIGQHTYGSFFYEAISGGVFRELNMERLLTLLLSELGTSEKAKSGLSDEQRVRSRIDNSYRKMSLYMEHFLNQTQAELAWKPEYVRSEQSLYIGHPFHPYPKSTEGFDFSELAAYSPEMGASFQLHYFAVRNELVHEEWLDGEEAVALRPFATLHARQQLGDAAGSYKLLPMHPWQAVHVLRQPQMQERMKKSDIISLGLCGPVVYPTSSVRTVWEPAGGYGFKLPLHVRITNLLRENTQEQAERTMDAARVLHHLKDAYNNAHFQILSETGYSSVRLTEMPEEWSACFTVIYRPMKLPNPFTYVLASALESLPGQTEPKLIQAIRRSGQGTLPDMREWLAAYLRISMVSLLRLLAEQGISFEAHLQNSLVSLKNGMPDCFYVRDLEGVSIDRRKAAEAGWTQKLLAENSPVLYEESEAWMRTKYYFFVNHLGSLVHTIAAYSREAEEPYWRIVQDVLQQERSRADERMLPYLDDLLHSESLPAKANFTSCFLSRGEKPLFVDIPNPMKV
ncbi:IucA/IucC family protein [Paenibacillus chondroitinus]|uniref:IucA/IucC family protein n=1 Tax=Paenibacillus chondroitinus TaxID=59842 RepID=A0ABU6DLD0_9BACL|nr:MULTISPECIES: IucA/IucC family protein [Paenibacillus]MCY9662427.1 short-chain oxidoreductase [Paenibacillus anseongense]MEB4798580.1 IucA/IucC family protein [Paenibacillus chondroitinus]